MNGLQACILWLANRYLFGDTDVVKFDLPMPVWFSTFYLKVNASASGYTLGKLVATSDFKILDQQACENKAFKLFIGLVFKR